MSAPATPCSPAAATSSHCRIHDNASSSCMGGREGAVRAERGRRADMRRLDRRRSPIRPLRLPDRGRVAADVRAGWGSGVPWLTPSAPRMRLVSSSSWGEPAASTVSRAPCEGSMWKAPCCSAASGGGGMSPTPAPGSRAALLAEETLPSLASSCCGERPPSESECSRPATSPATRSCVARRAAASGRVSHVSASGAWEKPCAAPEPGTKSAGGGMAWPRVWRAAPPPCEESSETDRGTATSPAWSGVMGETEGAGEVRGKAPAAGDAPSGVWAVEVGVPARGDRVQDVAASAAAAAAWARCRAYPS